MKRKKKKKLQNNKQTEKKQRLGNIQSKSAYHWKRQMTGKDVITELKNNSWVFVSQVGSHSHYEKNNIKVTVTIHGNKSIAPGTLQNIKRMVKFAESKSVEKADNSK